jgi:LysM repeat protein
VRVSRPFATIAAVAALALGAQAATGGGDIVVRPGDTLSGIAARNGVSTGALARANGISDPNMIRDGMILHLPGSGPSRYTVVAGDTLSSIARAHGVTVSALTSANSLRNPNLVRIGATLAIPAGDGSSGGGSSGGASGSYTVRAGDTLTAIAARYGVSTSALSSANNLRDRNLVRIGQRLTIPAGAAAAGSGLPSKLAGSPSRLALMPTFDHWAATYGVPADLLKGLCWLESGWQNTVTSSTGAVGIGQLMPDTVTLVNNVLLRAHLDPRDPEDNIRMSARFLRYLLDRTGGDVRTALASYYQGFRSVSEQGAYASTLVYVGAVLALRARF